MNRRHFLYFAAASAGAAVGFGYHQWGRQTSPPAPTDSAGAPDTPPSGQRLGANGEGFFELSFDQPDGKPLAMSSLRGKPLLVNFWATWCPPCIEELPLIDAFYTANASKNWQTLGLAVDQPQAVQKFLAAQPLSFPIAMAGLAGIELTRTLGNISGALPFSVLLNAQGALVQRKLGKLTQADLETWSKV